MKTNYPHIILKPGKERTLYNRHPWLFSGAVAKKDKALQDGDVAEVYSSSGEYLATGHFHDSTISVRILTFQQQAIDLAFYTKRFLAAIEYRKQLGLWQNPQINMFRLVYGEGDNLSGLIVDVYGNNAVIHAHSDGIHRARQVLAEALQNASASRFTTIYYKKEAGKKENEQGELVLGNVIEGEFFENGNRFYVNWKEGQKTGFFLDQRENRELLGIYSRGKKVLNAFAYSGGFSVYALQNHAVSVHSVDSSSKAIEWCSKNVEINSLAEHHSAVKEDVFRFLEDSREKYDLIALDPPAFAKSMKVVNQAVVGYRNVNTLALKKLAKNGILLTFSCSQAIDRELFQKLIFQAALAAERKVRILHRLTQSPDHPVNIFHPEGEYLKGLALFVE